MAVLTSQGTLPASGAEMTAAPITDTLNHIINTLNGNNLDENNVDYSSVDGVVVKGQANTITGLISHENTSAASGGVRTALKVGVNPGSGTAADNDGVEVQFYGDDDGGNATVFAEVETLFTDVSNGSEDADLVFKTIVAGTLTEVFRAGASGVSIGSLGVAFGDDEKLNFGTGTDYWFQYDATGTNFELQSTNTNGSGADGDIFVVQDGTNDVAFAGGIGTDGVTAPTAGIKTAGGVVVGQDGTGHDVQFFGDTSGQYMLWDQSADELVLTGDSKLSFHDAAGGENIIATSDGHLEVNAGTTLDITAPTVDLNSSTEFNIDTAAYDLNASGAVTVDGAGVSIDSSSASNFTTSGGALTLTSAAAATWSTAAGALTVNGTGGVNIQEGGADIVTISDSRALATDNTASINLDASGVVAIESSGGTISIGDDNIDQTINLATKGTRTLNVGINDGTDVTTLAVKGNTTNTGTITVGEDGTGYDVKLFGATSGKYMLWDEDADSLLVSGDIDMVANTNRIDLDADNDTSIRASADDTIMFELAGADDFSMTANSLNILSGSVIDLADDAPVQFGDDDDASIKWDATNLAIAAGSADVKITASNVIPATNDGSALGVSGTAWSDLFLASGSVVDFHAGDVTLTHSSNTLTVAGGTLATAALTAAGTVTVGEDDTGHDVQFFGAAAGAFSLWDEDQNRLEIRGATAAGAGTLRLSTGELTVEDGDKLGQIDFVAPLEASGTDAILVGASIYAEADDTFAADNNSTDLVFATGASAAAAERMRIESDGKVSIGVVAGDGKLNVHTASAGSVSAHANGDEVVIEGSGSTGMSFLSPADQSQYIYFGDPGNNRAGAIQYYHGNDGMYFYTAGLTTRMVLDGNGNMGVGGTPTSTQRVRLESAHASTQVATCVHTSATSPRGVYCQFTGAAPDDNSAFFFQGEDTGAIRINIWSDGDLANHDGTYGTISDVKFKEDIVDARSYWDDFKSLRYRKWRDKSDKAVQGDDAPYRLGLVAQEVESIFPLLVPVAAENESYEVDVPAEYDDEGNETKPAGKKTERRQSETETFKWVKSSIIEGPILAKVVQELQARVEALEAA